MKGAFQMFTKDFSLRFASFEMTTCSRKVCRESVDGFAADTFPIIYKSDSHSERSEESSKTTI